MPEWKGCRVSVNGDWTVNMRGRRLEVMRGPVDTLKTVRKAQERYALSGRQ